MAKRTQSDDVAEVEDLRALLRERGFRATPARIAVLKELRRAKSPLTHAELADVLVPTGFDKATVFRNLSDLTNAGLISRTELGDHVWRFEVLDPTDPDGSKHPHFVCVKCGDVRCLGEMTFTANSRRRAKVIGSITEVLIKGHCDSCTNASA